MTKKSPFFTSGSDRTGRWLVTCDHASNRVPEELGPDLGLDAHDMNRHIAYDIGALGVTLALAEHLESPAIYTNFSRLVIDPNRGLLDPTLLMKLYDGTIIPANRHAGAAEISKRVEAYHQPYHNALEDLASQQSNTVICAIHSFTPQLKASAPRPWQIGILSAQDKRLTAPLIQALQNDPALQAEADALGQPLCIGDNEPYIGYFPGDAIDTHTRAQKRANVLIELRSDLIETPENQKKWAALLAPILKQTLQRTGL